MKRKIYRSLLIGTVALSLCCCKGKSPDGAGQAVTGDAAGQAEKADAAATTDTATEGIVIIQGNGENGEKGAAAKGGVSKAGEDPGEASTPGGTAEGQMGDRQAPKDGEGTFSFADLKVQEFIFASGAGGWGTWMMVKADGSFSGTYSDSEMGLTGEGYPKGTMLWSDFSGRFTQPVKVDAHTYSMEIADLSYADVVGTEEIKDGILYSYTDVYGLDGTEEILVHLPGTPLGALSEEVRSWIGYHDLSATTDTELSFYVLENAAQGYGFKGYDLIAQLWDDLARTEEQAALLEASLQNDPFLTQGDMNQKTNELYILWDSVLNTPWQGLKRLLDEDAMAALTVEERAWIKEKERAVEEAGAGSEGGSIQPMLMNDTAAEMTKARVYELMELLDE